MKRNVNKYTVTDAENGEVERADGGRGGGVNRNLSIKRENERERSREAERGERVVEGWKGFSER